MLSRADLERALALALVEFAPAWKIVGDCAPVDPFEPSRWDSGPQSFQVTLRHRVTGHLKVLGRRVAYEPNASPHRAVALSLVESYCHGNAEPIRQYLEEIGAAATSVGSGEREPLVEPRARVLRRLRRELQIWRWRRAAGSADLGITRTRE